MKIALYIRLSKEDRDSDISKSIISQEMYLKNYIKRFNYDSVCEYIDDGYSGTNFNRPNFLRMIDDIKNQKIDTVITKDSSRLGRNISWVTFYIEEFFPSYQVRYIAVDDNYDSKNSSIDSEMLTFKSFFNDYYCKDISRKIKSSLRIKKIEGKFTGWKAPYGYQRKKSDYHQLEIDYEVLSIVQRIFKLAKEDNTPSGIARILNSENIPSPSVYAKIKYSKWSSKTIKDILENPTYIGNVTQGKRKKINHKVKRSITLPKQEWIIKENTHPAIIDKDTFLEVQKKLQRYHNIKNNKTITQEFINIMYCYECKAKIGLNYKKNQAYCVCNNYKKNYKNKTCTPHTINYYKLKEKISLELQEDIKRTFMSKKNIHIKKLLEKKREDEEEIQRLEEDFLNNYISYKSNQISKDNYFINEDNLKKKREHLQKEIAITVSSIKDFIHLQEEEKSLLYDYDFYLFMIDKIYLKESGEVIILLNYSYH